MVEEQKEGTGGAPGGSAQAEDPAAAGAPLSNTAPANCMGQGEGDVRVFLRGIDSLYLSYLGQLKQGVESRLVELRELARSTSPVAQARAQLQVHGHLFEVSDRGAGFYPFALADFAFRIRLASGIAKQIPIAVVQVSSEFLASVGVRNAEKELRAILEELADLVGGEKVGRVDLYADFASSHCMELIQRDEWVTRAEEIHTYSVRRKLSGWTLGLGGPIGARLYNKTLEIETQSHKFFFHAMWERKGWLPLDEVWRLEFELKRYSLANFGIQSIEDLDRVSGSLWRYLTTDWARLAVPNPDDETRARWKTHPLWIALQAVEWDGNETLNPRQLKKSRAPEDEWYLRHGTSLLASYMAREGITDWQAAWRRLGAFQEHLIGNYPEKYGQSFEAFLLEKVRTKQRQYGTAMTGAEREPGQDDEESTAQAYRRASRGH